MSTKRKNKIAKKIPLDTSYYINRKNKNRYGVLGDCSLKIGDYWVAGIVYVRQGQIFARVKPDFELNFVKETLWDQNELPKM